VFCLQADVSIREKSGNRMSLRDALVAILKATGGYAGPSAPRGVDIDDVFRIGDEATHTRVLTELYARMKDSPDAPDLTALFERLGVRAGKGDVEFDERAPLAAIRAAMTAGALAPVRHE
jgi:predicted metalloprotease with PDZ domain